MGGMYFEHVCSMSKQIEDWDWDSGLEMGMGNGERGLRPREWELNL